MKTLPEQKNKLYCFWTTASRILTLFFLRPRKLLWCKNIHSPTAAAVRRRARVALTEQSPRIHPVGVIEIAFFECLFQWF